MLQTVINVEGVVSSGQTILEHSGVVDAAVKFAEVWKCCRAHPHDQIFILVAVVLWITRIQFIHWLLPVRWMCGSIKCWNIRHNWKLHNQQKLKIWLTVRLLENTDWCICIYHLQLQLVNNKVNNVWVHCLHVVTHAVIFTIHAAQQSKGGIVFSTVCLWLCMSVCLFVSGCLSSW